LAAKTYSQREARPLPSTSTSISRFSLLAACALFTGDAADAQLAADMKLEDAGFVMRNADSAEKLARLRVLPPRQFVSRTGKSGRYYLWADPDTCRCVFVGHERAMQAYRDMRRAGLPQPDNVSPSAIAPERMIIRDMDADMGDVPDGDVLDYRF
jgi:hypothetical protein